MTIELKVPSVGESVTEVVLGDWLKAEGDHVQQDEAVIELESEKATFDAPAPVSGVLAKILKQAGETAQVGEVIAQIEPDGGAAQPKPEKNAESERPAQRLETEAKKTAEAKKPSTPPAAAKTETSAEAREAKPIRKSEPKQHEAKSPLASASGGSSRGEESVPMSPIRRRIAERLVRAQQTAALLTTFNEIDMSKVKELRKQHQDAFQTKHGVKLGFMSFFVKASVAALQEIPQVNAAIQGDQIIHHNYCDIGIAIGGGKGLVVPVLRNAENLTFAQIEKAIEDFARRAQSGELTPDELRGGTFTITNGGIYGSLLSTPIVNPPQSGVLGMHSIQERPVVVDGTIVARPMMYVALTYDHRLIDGREAVTFLRRVKDLVEEPERLLFLS